MPVSCWNCTNNSKSTLLRIVHPGGHTELHDRPVTAAEIMSRNPRCCIAYPYVFQQPWAIVAPDTVLVLGHKYYVVPMSTIRKLQRLSPRNSGDISISSSAEEFSRDEGMIHIMCCILRSNSIKSSCTRQNGDVSCDKTLSRRRIQDSCRGSPKKAWSGEIWQPSLESITEE
ncbi:hypothetical protein PIB30_007516 [Stylosanthes scabra]|uniref:Uncharacterized protein n=1 Tax=Stylosanthes scabra TaxID=79078 RepID=A0ABU6T5E4_9FABA|nr:hypothetical protein [Stylosanthes scabra]